MNTTQLACFLAVSDFLNFSKAAERLQMTQPAVSHQIRTLEDELKVKLFYRTSKQVRLTDAGRIFLSDARQMVDIAHRARRRFEAADRVEPELLRLGCDSFAGMYLFQDTLQQLHRERPALRPRLEVIPFQYIYRLLVDDVLDATATTEQLGKPAGSDKDNGKTTFVTLYGPDGAMTLAQQVNQDTCEAVHTAFGEKAAFLEQLAAAMLERRS